MKSQIQIIMRMFHPLFQKRNRIRVLNIKYNITICYNILLNTSWMIRKKSYMFSHNSVHIVNLNDHNVHLMHEKDNKYLHILPTIII